MFFFASFAKGLLRRCSHSSAAPTFRSPPPLTVIKLDALNLGSSAWCYSKYIRHCLISMMDNQTKPNPLPPADSLHGVCLDLWEKVETFLAEKTDAPLLQNVQAQLRISIGVVEAALERYQCVSHYLAFNFGIRAHY